MERTRAFIPDSLFPTPHSRLPTMKIKRFVAPDMRTAFAMVRAEQGPDAVILSNRVIDEGVEIVAATNYDEALVQRTLEAMRPAAAAAPAPAPATDTDANAAPLQHAQRISTTAPRQSPVSAHASSPAEAAADYFHPRSATPAPAPGFVEPHSFAAKLAATLPPAPAIQAKLAAPEPTLPYGKSEQLSSCSSFPRRQEPSVFASNGLKSLDSRLTSLSAVESRGDDGNCSDLPYSVPAAEITAAPVAIPAAVPTLPIEPPLSVVADNSAEARKNDDQLVQMRAELASMREMIEREMHRLTDERLRGSPVRMQAMELMEDYGFDAGITRDIALQIPADTEAHRGRGLMLGLLSKKLPVAAIDPLEEGGVIALVGPTGAGKTTTIAKLAAAFAAKHNARDVALVTTDTIRVGGREQLHSYGRQLGIAVHEADSDVSLAQTLERLRDYKLVLIDTAGLGQRDKNLVGQLNWLRSAGKVHTLLVLPANSHFGDLDEVVRRFSGAHPQGVVLTKLDETGRLGSALSVVVDHQLPMTWITDGQRVPQDLHRANSAHLVLRLDQLKKEAEQPVTEASHVA